MKAGGRDSFGQVQSMVRSHVEIGSLFLAGYYILTADGDSDGLNLTVPAVTVIKDINEWIASHAVLNGSFES